MNYPLIFINNIVSNNVYVYQSWENLVMGVSSRTVLYKKGDEEDIAKYRLISLIFRCNNISISKY